MQELLKMTIFRQDNSWEEPDIVRISDGHELNHKAKFLINFVLFVLYEVKFLPLLKQVIVVCGYSIKQGLRISQSL